MDLILYHAAGRKSAPKLAEFMGIKSALAGHMRGQADSLIRYGSAASVPHRSKRRVLNRRWALSQYGNRLEQMILLSDAGVVTPEFSPEPIGYAYGTLARSFGKPGRQTTKGRGITFYENGATLKPGKQPDMVVEFIPKDRQFRVHVICGSVRVREWLPAEGLDVSKAPIWNYSNGTYMCAKEDIPNRVVPLAAQALAALRLEFGAVDIITSGPAAYALEVNTAPGLGDETLAWYAQHLGHAIGLNPAEMPGFLEETETEDGMAIQDFQ